MFEAIFTAATGLKSQQTRIDLSADNLANVNTVGFKSSRLNFEDALYAAGRYPYANEGENQQKGHGVLPASVTRDMSVGSFVLSDRDLDFAIEGEGFFELLSPTGESVYARAGNFYISPTNEGNFLVNAQGYYVLSDTGERISVPGNVTSIDVNPSGELVFSGEEGAFSSYRFSVRTFQNLNGLESIGSGYFVPTEVSGDPRESEHSRVISKWLEASNVDLTFEITRLIRAQRAFQLASRALTTADDMEGIANNLRR